MLDVPGEKEKKFDNFPKAYLPIKIENRAALSPPGLVLSFLG
jgi:hypothetical protein